MKTTSPLLSSTVAGLLAATLLTASMFAQTPQPQNPTATAGTPPAQPRSYPAPTNLKALPKTLTGEQVHEIMEQWESALGGHCSTCHTPDPTNIGPNGRPRLNYADDSKPEKATARRMVALTEEINKNYISQIDSSGAPVTCGTCHRGHLGPEPFVAAEKDSAHKPPTAGALPTPPSK